MEPVMFSDYVNALRALANLPPGAFVPLLMFALVFYFAGKFFKAWVLEGHPFILALAAVVNYAFVGQMMQERQYILAIIFAVPLLFIGREGYRRLL